MDVNEDRIFDRCRGLGALMLTLGADERGGRESNSVVDGNRGLLYSVF